MALGRGPRLALRVVAVAARLVPQGEREAWLREWQAEILGRWQSLVERGEAGPRGRLDLAARAVGSFADALHYESGRWTMRGWLDDVALASRSLRRQARFSLLVTTTLAIGIGATTAIFGVAEDVLLRPFPYPEADEVVVVESFRTEGSGVGGNVTYPNLHDLSEATGSFEHVGLARWWRPALEDDRGAIVLRGATVTADFFGILGVEPGQGRFFRPDEQGEGRESTVVLSHGLWVERFGADSTLVGRDLRLDGETYRVIGVTSSDFEDPWLLGGPGAEPQVWRTVASPPSEWPRSGRSWKGIARLRDGVGLRAAQEEIGAAFARLVSEYPEANAERVMRITPLREHLAGPAETVLYTLLGSVAVLLLIACANLANLLLGRALDRRGAYALHRALGAPRHRILRRTLVEAGLLAAIGGVAGVGLAAWLGRLASRAEAWLPRPVTGSIDPVVLSFAAATTVAAALLFGMAPALHAASTGAATPGPGRDRRSTLGRSGQVLRRALVIGQVALTVSLLVGSGLLVRSFERLGRVDLGMRTADVVGVELHGAQWWSLDPAAGQALWDEVLAEVRSEPSVEAAGAIDYLPLSSGYSCDGIRRTDRPPPPPGEGRCAEVRVVLPDALEAMGIGLVRGRALTAGDGLDSDPVAVVDERLAALLWRDEDPVGQSVEVHTRTHRVVGIVRNMLHFGPTGEDRPMVYLHAAQEGWNGVSRGLSIVARGSDPGAGLAVAIRDAVGRVNRSIAVGPVATLDALLHEKLAAPRFRTGLMAAFGSTALLLALLGVSGVMSYSVARRTRELGVRLALGARPTDVRALIMREAMRLIGAGVVVGLVVAWALADVLEALLYQVSARDPIVYALVTVTLVAAALLACGVPARRASRVDPVRALASE